MIEYELFFNYSLDMFVVAGMDGYFKRVNPAFCNMLGYTESALLSQPYLDFVHPDDVDRVVGAVKNLVLGHPAFLVEIRLLTADGDYRLLEWTAYPDLEAGLLFAIARDHSLSNFDGQQLKLLIDSSPTAVFLVEKTGTISYSNDLAGMIFGYKKSELAGKPIEVLVPPKYQERHLKHRKHYTSNPAMRPMGVLPDLVGCRKSGDEFPIDVGLNPVRLDRGLIIICSVIDTSLKSSLLNTLIQEKNKLEKANLRLGHLADHDTLTGLYNRRAFERIFPKNLSEIRKSGGMISIILADIDHFKAYNDSFGHPAGDLVLKRLGEIMSMNIRTEDTVARVGGEEFIIVLPGVGYEQAIHFGERLRKVIEQDRSASRRITISLGSATYQFHSKPAPMKRVMQQIIAEADQAVYHSKSAGRNRITHFLDLGNIQGKIGTETLR